MHVRSVTWGSRERVLYSHVETAVSERCVFGMMSLSLDISRKQWEDRKIYGHFRSIDILSKSAQMHVSHSEVEYWIACFPYRLYFTNTLWTSRVIFSEQKKCMRSLIIDWTVDEKEFHFLWGWKVERVATISIIEAVNILARGT